MPDTLVRKVTIFVSSPNDVAPERGRMQAVTAKLNREYEGLIQFETALWEEHFYTADKSFQPQIPEAIASDIVVSIFWTRIGTELPADFPRMSNGKSYPSGTAYELLTALDASKAKAGCLCVPQNCRCDLADGGRGAPPTGADPARSA